MVGSWNIFWLVVSAFVSMAAPIGFLLYFRHKFGVAWKAVGVGAVVFIGFALVLEGIINRAVLVWNPHANTWFANPFVLAIYGAIMAAIFEEGGRYFGFKILLRRYRDWKDGVSYGIGHGGTEAIVVGGFGGISNLVLALLINSGTFGKMIASRPSSARRSTL